MARENDRNSSESSRASRSSSGSTASVSLNYNQKALPEPSSFRRETSYETTPQNLRIIRGNSSRGHQTHVQDVAKDSIHVRGSPAKTATREQVRSQSIKHIDSPRPLPLSTLEKPRVHALRESIHSVATPRNVPLTSVREKNNAWLSVPKDAPRLSYDERESRDNFKSSSKLKELPRLSLDSRRQAILGATSESKSSVISRDTQREKGHYRRDEDLQQEPGSYRPLSNIVAKLMGLEELPDSTTTNDGQLQPRRSSISEDPDIFSRSSRSIDERKLNQATDSSRKYHKDPNSPRLSNAKLVVKSKPRSRISLEPAPWKQGGEHPGFEKSASKHQEDDINPQNLSVSLYSEIEKRLSELDFKKSGKDLRALKQILEAMQRSRSKLKTRKENLASDCATGMCIGDSSYMSLNHGPNSRNCESQYGNCSMPVTSKGRRSLNDVVSPIVIIKPDKVVQNLGKPVFALQEEASPNIPNLPRLRTNQSVDGKQDSVEKKNITDLASNNSNFQEPSRQILPAMAKSPRVSTIRLGNTSKQHQHITKEKIRCPGKSIESLSPKLQQKTLRLEKMGSDSCIIKQHRVQPKMESGSFTPKLRPKPPINGHLSSMVSNGPTCLSQQGIAAPPQPESNIVMISKNDQKVKNQPGLTSATLQKFDKRESSAANSSEGSTKELAREQPSPVSVLDATFYGDESPSPVKKKSLAFTDDETPISADTEWHAMDVNRNLPNRTRAIFISERDYHKLEAFKHIVQKLWQLKSPQKGNQDSTISLYKDLNIEGRYVFEILFVSGFLGDADCNLLEDCANGTTNAIDPKLFSLLEQTKESISLSDNESSSSKAKATSRRKDKLQRRLIFDVANEILIQKLCLTGCCSQSLSTPSKRTGVVTSGQQLFRELHAEIERLQADSLNQSLDNEEDFLTNILWQDLIHTDFSKEISGLVLDIERLIFKDLIVELVHNEVADLLLQRRGLLQAHFPIGH
ncbi:hypothetical protein Nepgr_022198 [Nepenthes gracilis]|uniref:DUF4378 domain-containing protein n=1 Tax=Nepenthes gracilis TaxID=150966 RepID=A0AAD3T1D7_NEPGR|nr:hypothetical protein Nepgr_022198 [Nepenthes gracilis]